MKISQRSLIRAVVFIYLYILSVVLFGLLKIFHLNSLITDFSFLLLISVFCFTVFLFIKKFLKRYYNYRDKNGIIVTIAILLVIQNILILAHGETIRSSGDLKFLFYLLFIINSLLIIVFYIALFYHLFKLSFRHFKLMKWVAWSFLFVALIVGITGTSDLMNENDLVLSIEHAYPVITINMLNLLPFILLSVIYRRALMERY